MATNRVHGLSRPRDPAGDAHTDTRDGVYCDQLGALVAQPRPGSQRPLFEPVNFTPRAIVTDWIPCAKCGAPIEPDNQCERDHPLGY